ncbi:unnamed protein product [Pleuronectes platessa]|uniref:Uncharacterized protein n=1 Tax=Pleuronectes platessa TaxID=8262 RepID=A0A9N7VZE7_PLEPL|nr:unnamed protein product [Pleuronectes platessa]
MEEGGESLAEDHQLIKPAALISTTRGSGADGVSRVNDLIASMGRSWRRARAALITPRPRCSVEPVVLITVC